jgi:hypothetical protein
MSPTNCENSVLLSNLAPRRGAHCTLIAVLREYRPVGSASFHLEPLELF